MIEVLQVPSELEAMVALYRERAPRRVLEIGVWQGGTLREWLLNAAPETVVVAVDTEHPYRDHYASWGGNIHIITGPSQSPGVIASMKQYGPYDWAFIDGDHGESAVRADVSNVLPLMAPGGLLLLHDISPPEGMETYGPLEMFRELSARYETWTIQTGASRPESFGIGVVELPDAV